MAVWSSLRTLLLRGATTKSMIPVRQMSGHETFPLVPSRFQWQKFKDSFHFYFMLGAIPLTVLVTYVNVFVGPATLTEIPEGYVPKHYEYYRHPISRFIARYLHASQQQDYEKYCHFLFEESEKILLRQLEKDIKEKIRERNDYQAYYYRPVMAKYHRQSKEGADFSASVFGDK